MREAQFWRFLEGVLWPVHGREPMMAGRFDDPNPNVQAASHYIMSHAILPRDCYKIPVEFIFAMGKLLLDKDIQRKTREAIMIILAHHGSEEALHALGMYNMQPGKGLEVFAMMALDECLSWNNGTAMKVDLINRVERG
ncbi:hypothetical protein ACFL2G_02995 [Candidatus Omnitrophota bacterium]